MHRYPPRPQRGLAGGHPWVYDTEVADAQPAENGALVDVISAKGRYLGTGFISLHSKIRVRILSRNANDVFDEAFYLRRLSHAWEYRKTVLSGEVSSCRVIFGEADLFPGLTVDRFNDILVTQTLSLGVEQRKSMLFPLLVRILREDGQDIRGVYERNDVAIREREGMEQNKGFFPLDGSPVPESTQTEIVENGIRYLVEAGGWSLFAFGSSYLPGEFMNMLHIGIVASVVVAFVILFFTEKGLSAKWGINLKGDPGEDDVFSPGLLAMRVSDLSRECSLSPREEEVLQLLARKGTTAEIEENLFVARGTVKAHTSRIYRKLGVHSREELYELLGIAE